MNLRDSNFMKIETLVFAFRNVFEDIMPVISAILATSGWRELTKSCTSTMNFHMAYFSWIPQNNAKFRQMKSRYFREYFCSFSRKSYYFYILGVSHLNEHLDFMPTWHIYNIISDNIVIQLIWKFQETNWNPDWFIALMDSFDTNYIFTNNKKSCPIWPKCNTIPCYRYPASFLDQFEILMTHRVNELIWKWLCP